MKICLHKTRTLFRTHKTPNLYLKWLLSSNRNLRGTPLLKDQIRVNSSKTSIWLSLKVGITKGMIRCIRRCSIQFLPYKRTPESLKMRRKGSEWMGKPILIKILMEGLWQNLHLFSQVIPKRMLLEPQIEALAGPSGERLWLNKITKL